MDINFRSHSPGELLRIWRAAQQPSISQNELADRLGVSGGRIGQLETGGPSPGLELATRIEELTGIAATSWVRQEHVA